MTTTASRSGPSMKVYVAVWLGLILIVATEVLLAYAHLRPAVLLAALLALALLEAGAALLVFMHLKYERPTLFWSLIPALIFVLVLMDHLWPDALRLTSLRAP
jgi:cytochrome c oxidase subunit IV